MYRENKTFSKVDPAALHLLQCHYNYYGNTSIHDRVKHAVARRLRSFMRSDTADFSQPMRYHFALRNPLDSEGIARSADLIV